MSEYIVSNTNKESTWRFVLTDLDEEVDSDNDRVHDLLPCLERDTALVLVAVLVREVAVVVEVLARVHEVVEEAGADDRDDDVDPGEHGVKLHQSARTEDRAEESAEIAGQRKFLGDEMSRTHPPRATHARKVKMPPTTPRMILPFWFMEP